MKKVVIGLLAWAALCIWGIISTAQNPQTAAQNTVRLG